jgi:hypothetical protein
MLTVKCPEKFAEVKKFAADNGLTAALDAQLDYLGRPHLGAGMDRRCQRCKSHDCEGCPHLAKAQEQEKKRK